MSKPRFTARELRVISSCLGETDTGGEEYIFGVLGDDKRDHKALKTAQMKIWQLIAIAENRHATDFLSLAPTDPWHALGTVEKLS